MSINPFRSALQTLADLAETDGDYEKWLPILVDGSLEALPQFDHASITIRRSGDPLETIAATSERARQGDQLQRALCEGPCYDAALEEGFRFSPWCVTIRTGRGMGRRSPTLESCHTWRFT